MDLTIRLWIIVIGFLFMMAGITIYSFKLSFAVAVALIIFGLFLVALGFTAKNQDNR